MRMNSGFSSAKLSLLCLRGRPELKKDKKAYYINIIANVLLLLSRLFRQKTRDINVPTFSLKQSLLKEKVFALWATTFLYKERYQQKIETHVDHL